MHKQYWRLFVHHEINDRMCCMRVIIDSYLGVPPRKSLGVALSAASPRAGYRAVGFPLQSLTQYKLLIRFALILAFLILQTMAKSQSRVEGNCDYPNQMELNSPYKFNHQTDSLNQSITVTAIGSKELEYDIRLGLNKNETIASKLTEHLQGRAMWVGCSGGVTENGVMHPDTWEYKSTDGALTIELHGEYVTHIQITLAPISLTPVPRDGYIDD